MSELVFVRAQTFVCDREEAESLEEAMGEGGDEMLRACGISHVIASVWGCFSPQ